MGGGKTGLQGTSILFIIYCLVVGIISQKLEVYTHIPYTVILTAWGIICDIVFRDTLLDEASSKMEIIDPMILLTLFILPLVFESSLKVHFFIFDKAKYQILLFATLILGVSTFLTAMTLKGLTFLISTQLAALFTWSHSFLLGSILSATDPVAVVSLLEHVGASPVLSTMIEGESLFNDGTAMVLFFIFLEMSHGNEVSGSVVTYTLFRLTFVAVIVGWFIGHITSELIGRVKNDPVQIMTIMASGCFVTYYISSIHITGTIGPLCSEILSTVVCGLNIAGVGKSYIPPPVWKKVMTIWSFLAHSLNTVLFVLLGAHVSDITKNITKTYENNNGSSLFLKELLYMPVLYVALHVIRFVSISMFYPLLKRIGYGITFNEVIFVAFAGLRGAIGLGLGLLILEDKNSKSFPDEVKDLFFLCIGMTVLLTLGINANLVPKLLIKLKLLEKDNDDFTSVADEDCSTIFHDVVEESFKDIRSRPYFSNVNWEHVLKYFPFDCDYNNSTKNDVTSTSSENTNTTNTNADDEEKIDNDKQIEAKEDPFGNRNKNNNVYVSKFQSKIRRFYQRKVLAILENVRFAVDLQRRSFLTLLNVEEYIYDKTEKPFKSFELLLNKMVIGRMKSNPSFKQRVFSRLVSPTRLTSAETYECLLVFQHIHTKVHASIVNIRKTSSKSFKLHEFGSSSIRNIMTIESLDLALESIIKESEAQLKRCNDVILDLKQKYPIAIEAYENAFAYYTFRNCILHELHEHVEHGEMTENVYSSFLNELKRVPRYKFYAQQTEINYHLGINLCMRQESMTPYFSFNALKLNKYIKTDGSGGGDDDDEQNSHYVEMVDEDMLGNDLGQSLLRKK